ncbi:MAG TPA: ABC transporter permease [Egibacteraceae bacterium]
MSSTVSPKPAAREPRAPAQPGGVARLLRRLGRGAPIFLVLIVLLVWIGLLNPNFFQPGVLLAFLRRAAPIMILAAGQLFVIVSGGFDLSVGSLITVIVVVAAAVIEGDPAKTWPVMALLFAIGGLVGLVNGLITTRLKVPSFITTLGMLLILRGAVFYWTGGAPTGALTEEFRLFGRAGIEGVPGIGEIPYAVIVLLVVGTAFTWLLHRSTFGQQLFAAGGGPRAAELSGVDVPRVRTLAFLLSALSAVIAGILVGGLAGVSAQVGQGYEFTAISAVVLGGAVLGGGKGQMVPVIFAALTLEALFTLLNLLGLPQPMREAVQGLIIIGAVVYSSYRARRQV